MKLLDIFCLLESQETIRLDGGFRIKSEYRLVCSKFEINQKIKIKIDLT